MAFRNLLVRIITITIFFFKRFFIQGTKSQVWFKAVIIEGATWTRMLRCDAT